MELAIGCRARSIITRCFVRGTAHVEHSPGGEGVHVVPDVATDGVLGGIDHHGAHHGRVVFSRSSQAVLGEDCSRGHGALDLPVRSTVRWDRTSARKIGSRPVKK